MVTLLSREKVFFVALWEISGIIREKGGTWQGGLENERNWGGLEPEMWKMGLLILIWERNGAYAGIKKNDLETGGFGKTGTWFFDGFGDGAWLYFCAGGEEGKGW